MEIISDYKNQINLVCEEHHVKTLFVFGSAATGNLTLESDVDFLVQFKTVEPSSYFINYSNLKAKLAVLLTCNIDLLEEQTLSNPFLINSINATKIGVYG